MTTKVVYPVLDLGEDGDLWAIQAHVDDEVALRSVVVHLWELEALRDSLDWSDLRVGKASVKQERGRWVDRNPDDDPEGDAVFERSDDGEAWTFVDAR